jgi:integrase
MRVRLKGINSRRKRLAGGREITYYYAWKGGPRLPGKPGDPEFIAAYNVAVAAKATVPEGTLMSLMLRYQASGEFLSKAERTRRDYVRIITSIESEFGSFPLKALGSDRARNLFLEWRDRIAQRSLRQADYHWTVLALILSWGCKRKIVRENPCERGGRLYRTSRAEKVWTEDDEGAFLASAAAHMHAPLIMALWTGQRQGDLLRLTWSAYDGHHIRLQQSKTGTRVVIPVGAPLKAVLDRLLRARSPKHDDTILLNSRGRKWSSGGFESSWRKACARAGIVGVTFNDLRGTAVTRLALAEATEAEIATITGHSLRDVRSILDAHYLNRDVRLGESAIRKLENRHAQRTDSPDRAPDQENRSNSVPLRNETKG